MTHLPHPGRLRSRSCLALIALLAGAGPALACENGGNTFDWDHCWSGLRLILWTLSLVPTVGISFLVFQRALEPGRSAPPWPRTAFGRALALCWILGGLSFLVLFALLSNELRHGPVFMPAQSWFGSFLNNYWPLLLGLAIIGGGAFLIHWAFRHHEKTV